MKRPICYYGDPVLRQRAQVIESIDDEVRELAQDLIDTMQAVDGVGLAAPQIGVLRRIFVVALMHPNRDEENGPIIVMINPELSDPSEAARPYPQGCLSIPEVYADVVRPKRITVSWTDLDGNSHSQEFEGMQATQMMHENDHLNGVLFIDRLPPDERGELEPLLRRVKKKYFQAKKKA